ncbi:homocysteine S-methyltransferase family protein [Nocardioides sp.]|jgi:S-methylmethionine-dependent homocysteine/selenocysteine methylase|uniref:homocysteine S-methyltransferase family protein n=1 Tax=Nocardioides sp. TaxID=35761 RepID=UPI002F3E5ACE
MDRTWRWVTDGGLETDLIFHHGVDLPEFTAYPLLRSDEGRAALRTYYEGYAAIAERAGAGLRLESPTWRANPDWGAVLGDDAAALDAANHAAIEFLRGLADEWGGRVDGTTVVGMVGPRGDGYAAGSATSADEAADYHAAQVASFAAAGADQVSALTMTDTHEALGVARAAAAAGIPAVISFTLETDGRLPNGTPLGEAVTTVDDDTPPAYFMVNCAHPQHVLPAFADPGPWVERVRGLRSNASTQSHAELDEAETLDEGDLDVLVPAHRALEERLPALEIVGGCCGTDARHVAALWGVRLT